MKLKKRRKSSRRRGTRLCGWAAKKHKGKGNRGGMGMGGSGKHKKTYVIRYMWPYFGREAKKKERIKTLKYEEINLEDIEKKIEKFREKGLVKEGKDGIEISLIDYKILGEGEVKKKLIIKARAFSNSAKEKIEKAGGKALVVMPKGKKEIEKKEETMVAGKKAIKGHGKVEKAEEKEKKVGKKVAKKEKEKSVKK